MNKKIYVSAINKLKTSDEFKESLTNTLLSGTYKKRRFRFTPYYVTAASIVLILIFTASMIPKKTVPVAQIPAEEDSIAEIPVAEDPVNKTPKYGDPMINQTPLTEEYLSQLPKLTVSSEFEGMGFEGYMAYNVEELSDNNPWHEFSGITYLPVYKNNFPDDGLSTEEMKTAVQQLAKKLNFTGTVSESYPETEIIRSTEGEIEVNSSGISTITFDPEKSLPKEFDFTWNSKPEDAQKSLIYLLEKYGKRLGLTSPSPSLFTDYTYDGKTQPNYIIYDAKGDIVQKILAYNFNKITFYPSDEGNTLRAIRFWSVNRSQPTGNYPIISSDEAKVLLASGNFITTVPEEFPGIDNVRDVKLVYRTTINDEFYMPYYKFLVELPTIELENGLKTFGVYYVPAVKGEYLESMPLWDGSFN